MTGGLLVLGGALLMLSQTFSTRAIPAIFVIGGCLAIVGAVMYLEGLERDDPDDHS